MDIKELALQVAGTDELTGDAIIDFATRLIAAYTEGQEPVAYKYISTTYPDRFYQISELTPEYFSRENWTPVPLYAAPPEPAPQPAATTTPEEIVGYTVAPVVCAAPSSEEVQWRNIKHVVRTLADWAFGSKDNPRWGTAWVAMMNGLTAKDGPTFNLERLAARVPDGCVVVPRRDVIFAAGYLQGATTSGTDAEACGARLQKLIAAGEVK